MNINNSTPIVKKTLDLYKTYYCILPTFPKKDRYILGTHIESNILQILDYLLQASISQKQNKIILLKNTNNKLEMLKIFIRLTQELKLINDRKYLALEKRISEIGRMLGGWIKFVK